MKINKKIILPLLSAIALFVKESFGYELPDGVLDMVTDIILWAVSSAGILINPKKVKVYDEENMV